MMFGLCCYEETNIVVSGTNAFLHSRGIDPEQLRCFPQRKNSSTFWGNQLLGFGTVF